jgi:hypothetical protein
MTSPFARFNAAVFAWATALLYAGFGTLWLLDRAGHLPPPPLTATSCIDEKFKFLREASTPDRDLIAVGSSVTWRNLDFAAVQARVPNLRPLNAAPCYIKVHETAFLTRFYLDHMPAVRTVLSVLSMQDFQRCYGDGAFFDPQAARRYVFERRPGWYLYFLNLRPRSFLRDAMRIAGMRDGSREREALVMDRYGSGPLTFTPPEIRDDRTVTADCYGRLAPLAGELAARGVTWVVVLFPAMPAWQEAYDPSGQRDRAWREETKARLSGTGAVVLDARHGPAFTDPAFTDPDHLHWSSVPAFTTWIFERLAQEGGLANLGRGTADAL